MKNIFDRSKIFYPYVMNYIYNIHGFRELYSRGMINQLNKYNINKSEAKIKLSSYSDRNRHS